MSDRDDQLIAEFNARRSEAAFAALVRQHVSLVFATAVRQVGDPGAAEEITQNVFVALAQAADKLGSHPTIAGWLHQTALNKSREWLRSELRRRRREQVAFNLQLTGAEGDSVWSSLVPLLDEALLKLREPDRQAVILHFMEGQTFQEVGSTLGVGEDAARKRVHRCLDQLTRFFRQRGFGVPALAGAPLFALSSHAAPAGLAASATTVGLAATPAAASTSTLTLIKGTLKLMAWAKAKFAVVTGVVIILATATTLTVTSHYRHSPPTQKGRLNLPTGNVTPMLAYGYSHDVIILASDGSLWSWGEERLGWPVLGLTKTNIQKTASLRRIGKEKDWVSIAVGDSQNMAIKSDGTLWAWGENLSYQLGDGTKITRPTPVPSMPGNDWKQAAIGTSAFALKNDGTLWAWGNNYSGVLGAGSAVKTVTNAVQIGTATNWTKIFGGGIQTVGLQSDGSIWFWGSPDGDGQGKKNLRVPTRMSPDTNWVDACFAYFTVLALKSDGTLWTWGLDAEIYTGASDKSLNATPVQVGTDTDWQSISSSRGCFYSLLRKRDGSLWTLDASEHRIIKPASQYKPIAPRKIEFNKEIAAYAAGGDNIGIILTPDGEVWTWGKVIGENSPEDYWKNGKQAFPTSKTIDKPWPVFNIDSQD